MPIKKDTLSIDAIQTSFYSYEANLANANWYTIAQRLARWILKKHRKSYWKLKKLNLQVLQNNLNGAIRKQYIVISSYGDDKPVWY